MMPNSFTLSDFQYAHRGLWADALPENSAAAFQAAADEGFGIECDVHLSSDGVPMVFHDFTLERLTHAGGRVSDATSKELSLTRLNETTETIPTLSKTLEIMGSLPVLIEMKCNRLTDREALARAIIPVVRNHTGPLAVMSFDRPLLAILRELNFDLTLGCLIDPEEQIEIDRLEAFVSGNMISYLAPNIRHVAHISQLANNMGLPTTTWTVRTEAELHRARENKAVPIFEKLDPALVRRSLST